MGSPELPPRPRIHSLRESILRGVEKLYHPAVDDPMRHLDAMRALSTTRVYVPETGVEKPRYNFIAAFNHISFDDPILALWLFWTQVDTESERPMLLPASYHHMRFSENPAFATAYFLGSLVFNYERTPIIQAYQVGNPKYGYTEDEAIGTYKNLLRKMGQLQRQGSFSFMIAPEGHRSEQENSSLQEAEPGLGYFVRRMSPCVIMPLGITYRGPFKRNSLNPRSGVQLHIAEPVVVEDRITKKDERETIETTMDRIASVLPDHMRGPRINVGTP